MNSIRVALVENLERPRRMYGRMLEQIDGVQLCEAFHYPEELLERLDNGFTVDVILMDIRMDESLQLTSTERLDGIEAARQIRERAPRMPIILYSIWDNPDYYRRVEAARFRTHYAFVKRYALDTERLGEIIRTVLRGFTYIDPEVRAEMDLLRDRHEFSPLRLLEHDEQRKVLALLANGLSNEEIARTLARKTRWVEEEVKNIYEVLNLSNVGSGDSRRIRAARMYWEDRILCWETQPEGGIAVLAQDFRGNLRPLEQVRHEEQESYEDAKVINNAVS